MIELSPATAFEDFMRRLPISVQLPVPRRILVGGIENWRLEEGEQRAAVKSASVRTTALYLSLDVPGFLETKVGIGARTRRAGQRT